MIFIIKLIFILDNKTKYLFYLYYYGTAKLG